MPRFRRIAYALARIAPRRLRRFLVRPIQLNGADLSMYNEMWLISPDGQAHLAERLNQLPHRTLEFDGYFIGD